MQIISTYNLAHVYSLALALFGLHFLLVDPLFQFLTMAVVALGLSEVARSAKVQSTDKRTVDYLWTWAIASFAYAGWLASLI
jgi:hypothetical protein